VSAQHRQVTIQDTEMHRLSSAYVDQEYNIFVAFPPGYAKPAHWPISMTILEEMPNESNG
jgi:predicted alpha/beta superfamily hydrolase